MRVHRINFRATYGSARRAPSPPGPQRRVCAWCGLELSPGAEPVSHGICPRCEDVFFAGLAGPEEDHDVR